MGNNKISLDSNNVKLIVSDVEYFYDKNNVTCKAYYHLEMPRLLYALVGTVEGEVVATAFCAPDDTYNEVIGRKIALAKAESKAYNKANSILINRMSEVRDVVNIVTPIVTNFATKATSCVEHNAEYITNVSEAKAETPKVEKKTAKNKKKRGLLDILKGKNGSTN